MKIYKISEAVKDSDGMKLGLNEEYFLKLRWEKIKSPEDPYFFRWWIF
jgi:hypothetical protein